MNCHDVNERTADYLGDELEPDSRHAFEVHLAGCTVCRQRIEELTATLDTLGRLNTVSCEAAFAATRTLCVPPPPSAGRRFASMLVRTAAILVLGVFLGRASVKKNSPASRTTPPSATLKDRHVVTASAYSGSYIHPAWIERARRLGAGTSSSIAGQLHILARSADK